MHKMERMKLSPWLLMVLYTLLTTRPVWSEVHVLLDTTKESMLDWTRYPYGQQSSTPGWVEESFTNFEKGINWRSYVVCDVGYPDVNNWLWTPFVTRGDANRIYIEIKFSLRNCDLFPGTALQCKETFSLLYYEFDAATREPPPWEPESYKQIDVVAADEGRFTDNNEVVINTETRSVEVNKKGVYFAFRDQGACLSLLAVKIYYLKCPQVTVGLANFKATAAGGRLTSIKKVEGECVANAVLNDAKPSNLCKADGSWGFLSGQCVCKRGYQPQGDDKCVACPKGHYKSKEGLQRCQLCPAHSHAHYRGARGCECDDGHVRVGSDIKGDNEDQLDQPCFRPLSASVRNLHFKFLDAVTIRLSWEPPIDALDDNAQYRVSCPQCPNGLTFAPTGPVIKTSGVTVSGLRADEYYDFEVSVLDTNNINNNTSQAAQLSTSTLRVGTGKKARSNVWLSVDVVERRHDRIRLKWELLSSSSRMDVEGFEVMYSVEGTNGSHIFITKRDWADIKNLKPATNYMFQVRAQTARGWGQFSSPIKARTVDIADDLGVLLDEDGQVVHNSEEPSEKDEQDGLGIGLVLALATLSLLASILVCWGLHLSSRHQEPLKKRSSKDCDDGSLDYRGIENHFATESLPIVQGSKAGLGQNNNGDNVLSPSGLIYNPFSSHKTYVDPHTYEDPNLAVRQFAREIDGQLIRIQEVIGGGEFGEVCKGILTLGDHNDMLVAIKTLKPWSTDRARVDFLTEASIMGQFEHPNVIFLQGVVTKSSPIMIVTEFMENGSLDTFLKANDGKFEVIQLVGMMRGIAFGMQYLSEMSFVHRDLAARNVLVNSQLVCKIADFGLSREIRDSHVDGAYTTRGGKIPVRWTAPEAIAFRKFTSASDVWSFGIVMWEVMSYGERPYWTWSNQDVIKAIEKGYRLTAPMDCPEAIHQLMLDSWQKERAHRPSFVSIVKTLDKLICCPETLTKIAFSPEHNPYSSDIPDYTAFTSVDAWLNSLKMGRYSAQFAAGGIETMGGVAKLSLSDLNHLGVVLVGHQKKIMNSIQALRAQMAAKSDEGFLV